MSRLKSNRYRIVTDGLKVESSLALEFCRQASEKQIIETILAKHGFWSTLESFQKGIRKIELIRLRVHKEREAE